MAVVRPVEIALVVAVAANGVIGRGGQLPWRMPSDLKTFRKLTIGKPIVMGRKTFRSIGRALDGRDNIVVTRDPGFSAPGVLPARSLDDALAIGRDCAKTRGVAEIMVIGGADIYTQAMALADRIYLTRIAAEPAGDAIFADPDPAAWQLREATPIAADPRDEHAAVLHIYERRQA